MERCSCASVLLHIHLHLLRHFCMFFAKPRSAGRNFERASMCIHDSKLEYPDVHPVHHSPIPSAGANELIVMDNGCGQHYVVNKTSSSAWRFFGRQRPAAGGISLQAPRTSVPNLNHLQVRLDHYRGRRFNNAWQLECCNGMGGIQVKPPPIQRLCCHIGRKCFSLPLPPKKSSMQSFQYTTSNGKNFSPRLSTRFNAHG